MQSPNLVKLADLVKLAAVTLALVGGLTACGQKGPLYLPQPEEQVQPQEQASTTQPPASESTQ